VITVGTAPGPASSPAGPEAVAERLTTIEELDYLLEQPAEPNLVLWEVHSHGHLDRTVLAGAVTTAFGADSGARRRLAAASRWSRRLYWRSTAPDPAVPPFTVDTWRTPAELEALRERLFAWPISLADAVARVILAVGPEHDVLIVQVHHTAFDGISSLRLLSTITQAYRAHVPAPHLHPAPDSLPHPAPVARPDAATTVPTAPPPPSTSITAAPPASRPGPVTRIAPQGGQPGRPGYGFVLTADAVPRSAPQGDGPQPTVNDLLVAALCLTIDRWNTARGRASGQITVTIPVNGRAAAQRWQGDGNLSWLTRVVTRPSHRASPDLLLGHVAAQTRAARERGRTGGTDALSRLLATGWAPVALKQRVARLIRGLAAPVLTDTSLVSNLGLLPDPPTFDGSGTEQFWLAPPCPMPRGLAIGAVSAAGRLYLSVRYRLTLLDQAAAQDFTTCFRAALGELARPGRGAPPEAPL
jgi:NRPS condensation-like uncharacterized protein